MAGQRSGNRGSWKGFFNFYLEDGQKTAIKKLSMSGPTTVGRLQELADHGYKVSVSFSVDREAYFVSCTGGRNSGVNVGYTLTQAHADLAVAVACVWFIVSEVFDLGAWPVESSDDEVFDW